MSRQILIQELVIVDKMDSYIQKAVNKYFNTISKTGYINNQDKVNLFVATIAYDILKTFTDKVTKEDISYFRKYITCHTNNSCLFGKKVPEIIFNEDNNALHTILTDDIITTTSDINIISTQKTKQNFTDFEIRTEIQPDNYVVGYDVSDDKEIAVNISNIGVFWE